MTILCVVAVSECIFKHILDSVYGLTYMVCARMATFCITIFGILRYKLPETEVVNKKYKWLLEMRAIPITQMSK